MGIELYWVAVVMKKKLAVQRAKHTILKLLKKLGCAGANYHDSKVRNPPRPLPKLREGLYHSAKEGSQT